MLGQELSGILTARGMGFVGSDREIDIRDISALRAFATGNEVDWIVNCSAYTAVDKAEDEEELARSINATGAENIALVAAEIGATLIHISTDYVFRGDGNRPYVETDPMDPTGAYGRTKAAGERLVASACPRHFILRTAWLYGKHGPNFVYTMLRLMRERESINVVMDQRGTPTWTFDLASAIADIVEAKATSYGTYHYTNEGETSWHGFAVEIERLGRENGILEKPCEVVAITSDQYPSKVKRPAWSVLSKAKIKTDLGIVPSEWKASLGGFFDDALGLIDDARDFATMADYDLESASAMLKAARYLYVAFACQQAVEKLINSILAIKGLTRRIHNLVDLARLGGLSLEPGEVGLLKLLSEFYLRGRYPDGIAALLERVEKVMATNLFEETRSLCGKLRKHPIFALL